MDCHLVLILVFVLTASMARPIHSPFPRAINEFFQASQSLPLNDNDGIGLGKDIYKHYQGDGSSAQGWPGMSDWVSYQQMFDYNANNMKVACTNLGFAPGFDTSDEEIGMIWNGIQAAAEESGVDHRFILAIMMQESKGCVRIWTTKNANPNPGLMQDHDGRHQCNAGNDAADSYDLQSPCSQDEISGMIEDGVGGTEEGDGLSAYLNKVIDHAKRMELADVDGGSAQVFYQAARLYNSGSIDYDDLGRAFSSNPCYASDIANRLTGWVFAQSECHFWA